MSTSVTAQDGLPAPRRTLAMVALMCTITMAIIDSATVNVALPTIAREFNVLPEHAIWIVSAYQTAFITSLFAFAALGEIHGYRRVFGLGLWLFILSSLICAMSRSFPALFLARTAQGFASASIFGVSTALMRFTQPRARLGRSVGDIALLVAVALAAGPIIGSAVMAVASWWCIFLVSVPIGLVAVAFLKELPETQRVIRPFDLTSARLEALVLGLFFTGLGALMDLPVWGGAAMAASAILGGILVRRESGREAPLVPVSLIRIRPFAVSISASACCFAAQTCAFVGLPLYLQYDLALGDLETGILLTTWPVAVAFTAPVAGRLADRFPASILASAGAGVMAAGLLSLAIHPAGSAMVSLFLGTIASGIGFGLFQTPNNRAMLLAAPIERSGAAGGLHGTAPQVRQDASAGLGAL